MTTLYTATVDVGTDEDVFERLDSIRKDHPELRFEGAGEFTESGSRECPQVIARGEEAPMRAFLASYYDAAPNDDYEYTGVSPNLPAVEPVSA
jgi:hypothetical protein